MPILLVALELVSLLAELGWFFGFVSVVGRFWLLGIDDFRLEGLVVANMTLGGLEVECFVTKKPLGMEESALVFCRGRELVSCFVDFLVAADVRIG